MSWFLPSAAAAAWAAVLALAGLPPALGLAAALLGAAVIGACLVGALRADRAGAGSASLLAAAGLVEPAPVGPRQRVLAAAGLGGAEEPRGSPVRSLAAILGLAAVVGGWSAVRSGAAEVLRPLDGASVGFEGALASDPRPFAFGWGAEVRLELLRSRGSTFRTAATVWVRGSEGAPALQAGDRVAGRGLLLSVDGGSGFEEHLRARGVGATLSVSEVRGRGPPGNPALATANAARRLLRAGAERALPAVDAGLLLGLSVGDTRSLDPEVEEDFRATGLGHLLAVSGSNVAMVLAPVLALAMLLGAGPVGRAATGLAAVVLFALVTRWEPSVLRASVMAGLALLGVLGGRPRSTAALLGGSVLLLLAADPSLARSLGFALSVAATAGIVALAGPLAARLSWLPRPIALAAAATLGAQLAVTPLLLAAFGVVPTVTLLANVLAFPAVPPALAFGLAASAAGVVWPAGGEALGWLARLPLAWLRGVADALAKAPLPSLTGRGWLAAAVATALAAAIAWRLRRGAGRPLIPLALATALVWVAAARAGPPARLTVTFFDVGQGDAALVRAPDGATVLVDGGPDEQLVAERLAALGVGRLDVVVATHGHADHVVGLPAVLARHPVGMLLEPGCPADSPSRADLLRAARAEGVPLRAARGGELYRLGSIALEVLGPDGCGLGGEGPNDDSVVFRLVAPGATVLFPGDAEVPAQRDLLADGDPVRADVLKVPHHGGDTSDPAFLAAAGARVAVVSVGENDYGHPTTPVLRALSAGGATVIRTDRAGDVTVGFAPEGPLVESAR